MKHFIKVTGQQFIAMSTEEKLSLLDKCIALETCSNDRKELVNRYEKIAKNL